MHRSFRSRVRVPVADLLRHRPRFEQLEPRLPPGDALLGMLLAWPDVARLTTPEVEYDLFATRDRAAEDSRGLVIFRRGSDANTRAITATADNATLPTSEQRATGLGSAGLTAGISPAARHAELGQRMQGFSQSAHASVPGLAISAPRAAGYNPAVRTATGHGTTAIAPAGLTAGIDDTAHQESRAVENYGDLPLTFEANHGQINANVDFIARTGGATVFLTPTSAVFSITQSASVDASARRDLAEHGGLTPRRSPESTIGASIHMQIIGADPGAQSIGVNQQPGIVNYFIGNDLSQWHSNIPTFGGVRYDDVYPGIDLAYYGGQSRDREGAGLEYDFIVSPEADPSGIMLNFAGADRVDVNEQGDLVLHTSAGELVQQKPFTYQEVGGTRHEVASAYVVEGTEVRFDVGAYDATRELVIDPLVLGYSTFLGGIAGGSLGNSIAVDRQGRAFIVGSADSDFPVTPGAFDTTHNGPAGRFDVVVTKLTPDGSGLVYSTFIGGSHKEEAFGIALDSNGNAFVTGITRSTDFPITAGVFQTGYGGGPSDAFVVKLNSGGDGLVYASYLGGSGRSGEEGNAIAIDVEGRAYVTGQTGSADFPVTPGAFQTVNGDAASIIDCFVAKLAANGSALEYATFLGGVGGDVGRGIAVNTDGHAHVTGWTQAANFPTTPNAFQTVWGGIGTAGYGDVFVTKLAVDGSSLVYSTFMGGTECEAGLAIALGPFGTASVTGLTQGKNFPTTPNSFDNSHGGEVDAFVARLNSEGSGLVYSTYLGGIGTEYGFGIAVDRIGTAFITGLTSSPDFPISNAFQSEYAGGQVDAFVVKLGAEGSFLKYSTYLGGNADEFARGIDLGRDGNAYVTGSSNSPNFPTTPGAFKTQAPSNGNAQIFVTRLVEHEQ